jgi:hypothetical protein
MYESDTFGRNYSVIVGDSSVCVKLYSYDDFIDSFRVTPDDVPDEPLLDFQTLIAWCYDVGEAWCSGFSLSECYAVPYPI